MTKHELNKLQEVLDRLEAIEERVVCVEDLKEITPTLKRMAEAWESAGWFGRAVKYLGGIALAVAAIIAAFRLGMPK